MLFRILVTRGASFYSSGNDVSVHLFHLLRLSDSMSTPIPGLCVSLCYAVEVTRRSTKSHRDVVLCVSRCYALKVTERAEMTRKFLFILIPFSLILVFSPPAGAQTVFVRPNDKIVDLATVWGAPKEWTNREPADARRLRDILELCSRYGKECWNDSLPEIAAHVDWKATREFHKKGGQDYVLISKEDTVGWNHREQTLQGIIEFLRKQK